MYCELIKDEIELIEKIEGNFKIRECTKNYTEINGVICNTPCKFRFNDECLQLKNRIGKIK